MKRDNLIPIDQFCVNYEVEFTFLYELYEYGLVEIKTINPRIIFRKKQYQTSKS
ncbi:MAG: chaperone modulator CbpM [Flavobacteriaceae bacterium]|nr:chaperone modulator CbpM [Flavobacteriaceae bacterium]